MTHITLLLLGTHGQFSNFPGGRQKFKLIIIPAAEKTIQRQFAAPRGDLNPGSTCGPGGAEGFLRVRRRTAQEEGAGHAHLDS